MDFDWATIIASISGSGALCFLLKDWISTRLKASIKHEYDEILESQKKFLEKDYFRFSKLHEQRVFIIAKIYALLKEVYLSVGRYTEPFEPVGEMSREERRKKAYDTHEKFFHYYQQNQIYLPQKIAVKIDNINFQITRIFNEFASVVDHKEQQDCESLKIWHNVTNKLQNQIRKALTDIEHEFRNLLGAE